MCRMRQGPICQGRLGLAKRKGVEPRFFVLTEDCLQYWKAQEDAQSGQEPRGYVAIADIRRVELEDGKLFIHLTEEGQRAGLTALEGDPPDTLVPWAEHLRQLVSGNFATSELKEAMKKPRRERRRSSRRTSDTSATSEATKGILCQAPFLVELVGSGKGAEKQHLVLYEDRLDWYACAEEVVAGNAPDGSLSTSDIADVEVLDSGFLIFATSRRELRLKAFFGSDLRIWTDALMAIFDRPAPCAAAAAAAGTADCGAGPQTEEAPAAPLAADPPPQLQPQPQPRRSSRRRASSKQQSAVPPPADEALHRGTIFLRHFAHEERVYLVMTKDRAEYFADPAGAALGLCLGRALSRDVREVRVVDDGFSLGMGFKTWHIRVPPGEDLEVWLGALRKLLGYCEDSSERELGDCTLALNEDEEEEDDDDFLQNPRGSDLLWLPSSGPLSPIPEQPQQERSGVRRALSLLEGTLKFQQDGRLVARYCRLKEAQLEFWDQARCAAAGSRPAGVLELSDFAGVDVVGAGLVLRAQRGSRKLALHVGDAVALRAWRDALDKVLCGFQSAAAPLKAPKAMAAAAVAVAGGRALSAAACGGRRRVSAPAVVSRAQRPRSTERSR